MTDTIADKKRLPITQLVRDFVSAAFDMMRPSGSLSDDNKKQQTLSEMCPYKLEPPTPSLDKK
jgi:hypothetical protein